MNVGRTPAVAQGFYRQFLLSLIQVRILLLPLLLLLWETCFSVNLTAGLRSTILYSLVYMSRSLSDAPNSSWQSVRRMRYKTILAAVCSLPMKIKRMYILRFLLRLRSWFFVVVAGHLGGDDGQAPQERLQDARDPAPPHVPTRRGRARHARALRCRAAPRRNGEDLSRAERENGGGEGVCRGWGWDTDCVCVCAVVVPLCCCETSGFTPFGMVGHTRASHDLTKVRGGCFWRLLVGSLVS